MLHILVSNDDGIHAPGLRALVTELRKLRQVKVTVVAPDREQSAKSHSITCHRPLRFTTLAKNEFAVSGTPTDSVFLALNVILKKDRPDFVFSGINRGGNLGNDVHYSGTVSAAVESALFGIPSVAFSQVGKAPLQYHQAALFAVRLLQALKKNPLPADIVLNVNVPAKIKSKIIAVTRTGKRVYGIPVTTKKDPLGKPYYWIGGNEYKLLDLPESDGSAIIKGQISITPLMVNLTCEDYLDVLRQWKI